MKVVAQSSPVRWSLSQRNELVGLFQEGKTAKEAADHFGISVNAIHKACYRYNISIMLERHRGNKAAS